ncbi:hypothetical protein ACFYRC_20220 [Streptomyces sp. NPDC005279]|uniref:hypothetical protein n=1 Tax=Streptomyces sp. NPDC005279 TaxID=3364712 RepID=UPI0036908595
MQRSTDGTRFNGVAEAFPVVQRAQAPAPAQALVPGAAVRPPSGPPARIPDTGPAESGTGTGAGTESGTGTGRVVQLAVAAPAPPVALPVQRAPATPPVESRLPAPPAPPRASAPRPAEPRPAPVTVQRTGHGGDTPAGGSPPPAGSPPPGDPPSGAHRPNSTRRESGTGTAGAVFDARHLTDGQVDELTHRLIGPLTRLLRTELRLDRERIGKLRDPRR